MTNMKHVYNKTQTKGCISTLSQRHSVIWKDAVLIFNFSNPPTPPVLVNRMILETTLYPILWTIHIFCSCNTVNQSVNQAANKSMTNKTIHRETESQQKAARVVFVLWSKNDNNTLGQGHVSLEDAALSHSFCHTGFPSFVTPIRRL